MSTQLERNAQGSAAEAMPPSIPIASRSGHARRRTASEGTLRSKGMAVVPRRSSMCAVSRSMRSSGNPNTQSAAGPAAFAGVAASLAVTTAFGPPAVPATGWMPGKARPPRSNHNGVSISRTTALARPVLRAAKSSVPPASSQVFLDNIPSIRAVPHISTWPEIEDVTNALLEEAYYEPVGTGEAGELVVAILDQTQALFERANEGG